MPPVGTGRAGRPTACPPAVLCLYPRFGLGLYSSASDSTGTSATNIHTDMSATRYGTV